ncbi:hypothetical protein BDN70DRAFT_897536 [Pholiota conissans]|uniref:Uncharacterized protein n=1 Tax=Pholiota conissans TaxID=109636 RepID=A0A9P5YUX9_9AGAR|nr:hypothetical protein BDN70DRAFT_897536 [Pholiota conissans]
MNPNGAKCPASWPKIKSFSVPLRLSAGQKIMSNDVDIDSFSETRKPTNQSGVTYLRRQCFRILIADVIEWEQCGVRGTTSKSFGLLALELPVDACEMSELSCAKYSAYAYDTFIIEVLLRGINAAQTSMLWTLRLKASWADALIWESVFAEF